MLRRRSLTEHWLPSTRVANGILAAAGVSSILVLSNFLYHYGWVGDRHFTSTAGIVWYFAPPAALAFVCFGALRLTPTHKRFVSVLCLALALLVYGAEIVLDATDRGEDGFLNRLARARSYGKGDTRDVNQVVAELRRSGVSAVRVVATPTAPYDTSVALDVSSEGQTRAPELMPLSGIARRPTVACHDADRWFVYDSDEHGFHNPLGLWKRGQVDIAAVGNSVTLGACVPADRNFVSLIRVHYPATVNLAMNGEGPLQILAITKEYLSVLQPKILIWFYFEGNSLRELQDEKKYELLLRYVNRDFTQGLIGRQVEIDQALSTAAEKQKGERERQATDNVYTAALATLHRMSKLTSLRNAFGLVYGADAQAQSVLVDIEGPTMELFRQIVASMKSQVSSWGGTLVFAYLPSSERYATWRRPTLSVDSQQRTKVLQVVAEEAIPVIDLHPLFQARANSLFPQGRVNEEGHRLIAQQVLDAISSIALKVRR
jgi:hypothetical protein